MNHLFLIISVAIIAASCNNKLKKSTGATNSNNPSKGIENKIMVPVSTCYSTTGRDTILLKVEVFEHVVTGELLYKLHKKDSNRGGFDGHLHGDTLLADYTFRSEGKTSVRQIIFLIKDSMATEGYGAMEEKDGKMVFKNENNITFGKGLILKKTPCGEY